MKVITTFGIYDDVYLRVGRYFVDGALFIDMHSVEEGPLANITVCLCDPELAPDESYVDVNNFPEVLEVIADLNLGTPVIGKEKDSGYVTYPAVKFNKDAVLSEAVRSEGFNWEDKVCT